MEKQLAILCRQTGCSGMLLIAEPEGRGFLSTPYIYASPDLRHEAEPIKLAMQEKVADTFVKGMRDYSIAIKKSKSALARDLQESQSDGEKIQKQAKRLKRPI